MSSLQIGRLLLAPPLQWQEQAGDPITNLGGSPIPAPRAALRHSVSIGTFEADGVPDTQAARLTNRRQLRSILNNTPLKLAGGIYVIYSDDPEQNGWYVIDQGQFADGDGTSGLATGFWQISNFVWMKAGAIRTNREARNIWMKPLTGGLNPRDTLRWIFSTDFSALPTLSLTLLPHGANSIINTVSGQVVVANPQITGRDGGACQIASGLVDLTVVSFERAEAAQTLSDVIVYDRRGQITAPATGPDVSWEEVYGPDYPWSWTSATPIQDCPVLDNGLVRVRWDGTNTPGFRIDAWNGSTYVEQGKVLAYRYGDVNGYDDTWVSAGLREWSGDRCVVSVVASNSGDIYSREQFYITMQRGQVGCRFEVYPALAANGTQAGAELLFQSATVDANSSAQKIDSQAQPPAIGAGTIVASAGSGSANLPNGYLGATSFASSENDVALLRYSAVATLLPFQVNFAVLQAAGAAAETQHDSLGYGGPARSSTYFVGQAGQGYLSLDISFAATSSDQCNEAESIRNGSSGTTAIVADATASNGSCVSDAQAAQTNNTLVKATTNLAQAKYRIYARCKVTGGTTGSFIGYLNGQHQSSFGAPTTTSTTWVWLDLGEVLTTAANQPIVLTAWSSAGGGTVYIDRVELFLLEDRTAPACKFSGSRDLGQSCLMDARTIGALVAR